MQIVLIVIADSVDFLLVFGYVIWTAFNGIKGKKLERNNNKKKNFAFRKRVFKMRPIATTVLTDLILIINTYLHSQVAQR